MRGRELGDGLRKVLTRSGFSGRKLATLLGWDHVKLVDLLNGKLGVTEVELAALLGACHAPPDEHAHLLALYREANVRGWWQQHGSRLPIVLRTLIEHENVATEIICWQINLIPGLLQTPAYAHAVITADPNVPADEVDQRVQARLTRQEIIERGVKLVFYVHEQALRLQFDAPEIMPEQLHHLLQMSVRTNVSLRIVPSSIGPCAGLTGPFVLLKFDGIEPIAHAETQTSTLFIEDKTQVQAYSNVVKALETQALGEAESRRLITEIVA
ncbi:hypothetical protein Lesp02_77640 [Lentzea sp. NBRC 105346]|uniref:helix-turn-helix domain-containing protein n=1 Tax=Lentzea sp. NBRC 105346 TaxID=3032205 RepID=UPI0024A42BB1|nr:helix-turn-helix transcriptional regulator [Lentzea sp. NBRC 105346]GLZ35577.1 hypothetical protein Lesp02_77640 [Lentzea sp. NBRC 105346]